MGEVLGIVYRCIATHLIRKAGFSRKTARTGAVTLMLCMDARMPRIAWMRESGPAIWVGGSMGQWGQTRLTDREMHIRSIESDPIDTPPLPDSRLPHPDHGIKNVPSDTDLCPPVL